MSVWAKKWAYERHPVRLDDDRNPTGKRHPAAKAVLVALAEFPGVGQRVCWPSQATLAAMTDFTERQVRACLRDLKDQGLIDRDERRREDGSRRSDRVTLLGKPEDFGPPQDADEQPEESSGGGGREFRGPPEESSGHEPSVRTANEPSCSEEVTNVPSSAAGQKPAPVKPVPVGQYGIRELAQRTNAARARGATIHTTTDRERRDFGAQFKQAAKDGHDLDLMLLALDYMVAKAAGEVEDEPRAWCGYRTALDRVLEGWRPRGSPRLSEEQRGEIERENAENAAMLAELLEAS